MNSERITFTRDAHGSVRLDLGTLKAVYSAHRPGTGKGMTLRVPSELVDEATVEFQRKVAEIRAHGDRTHDQAVSLAIAQHRELFFLTQCDRADGPADADVVLS